MSLHVMEKQHWKMKNNAQNRVKWKIKTIIQWNITSNAQDIHKVHVKCISIAENIISIPIYDFQSLDKFWGILFFFFFFFVQRPILLRLKPMKVLDLDLI